jgi:Mg2+-importing ATPase
MTIASDNVDTEMVAQPQRWDIKFIRKFMITFGIVSSIFDYMTFGLLLILEVSPEQFRTAWFLESVVSAASIVFVVRSRHAFFKSRPGKYLTTATLSIVAISITLPYTPIAAIIGFVPLPLSLVALLLGIVLLYLASAEIAKHFFYQLIKS